MHPDIGKRVEAWDFVDSSHAEGVLRLILNTNNPFPYLVECDGEGIYGFIHYKLVDPMPITEPITLDNAQPGQLFKDQEGFYKRFLQRVGEGEYGMLALSFSSRDISSPTLDRLYNWYTSKDSRTFGLVPHYPSSPAAPTTIEILGKKYKTDEVRERLAPLKAVE
jgi:hypothetical protein